MREAADTLTPYFKRIRRFRLLSAEEEKALGRRVQKGDTGAKKVMVECNLRLVIKIARPYAHQGLPFEDLIQEGNLGLIRAVEKFDPKRTIRFSTYAAHWIREKVERALMRQVRAVRLPIPIERNIKRLQKAREVLGLDDARTLARYLDQPVEQVEALLDLDRLAVSLDDQFGEAPDHPLLDTLAGASGSDPVEAREHALFLSALFDAIDRLAESERFILVRRYGLDGQKPMSLKALGQAAGCPPERIRYRQTKALGNLRSDLCRLT